MKVTIQLQNQRNQDRQEQLEAQARVTKFASDGVWHYQWYARVDGWEDVVLRLMQENQSSSTHLSIGCMYHFFDLLKVFLNTTLSKKFIISSACSLAT